jgi:hypothetical protein
MTMASGGGPLESVKLGAPTRMTISYLIRPRWFVHRPT